MKTNLKNYLLTLLASGSLLLTAGSTLGQTDAPDAAAIRKTPEEFHQALADGQPDQVMALLHPDALIVEGGTVQTRDEYQSEHLAADIAFASAVPGKKTKVVVRQEGEAAWVTSTFIVSGKFKEKAVNERAAETMVLQKTADGWRIRSIHWSSEKASGN